MQLQISPPIVIATYVIVLGLGLGLALAFGLCGRAVASDLLRTAYDKTAESMPQMREEAELIKDRAGDEM